VSLAGRNRAIGLALAAVVFGLDRLVKALVVGPVGLTEPGMSHYVLPFFSLTRENNYGVSLGMFPAASPEMRWLLVLVTAAIAVVVIVWLLRERRLADILPLGLVLGGAAGNILDRVTRGWVVDYADLHFGDWRPFLIFNLADAAISVGVVIILVRALFMREKPPSAQGDTPADQPAETVPDA
jgi:signal peptidase II